MHNQVISFINHFSSFGQPVIDCFTRGNCYWFASLLKERFPDGEIVYNIVDNHFGWRRAGMTYDITGAIDGSGFINWNEYQKIDPLHCSRIIHDCVIFD